MNLVAIRPRRLLAPLRVVFAFALAASAADAAPRIEAAADGLVVGAFRVGPLDHPGGRLAASLADGVLALNLRTRSFELLDRDLGQAHLALARVRRASEGPAFVEPLELRLPETRIPRSLAKLQAGEPLRVRCYGTSLVAGGAGARGWQRLVFDPSLAGEGFAVSAPAKVRVNSHAVGGTHSRYTFALLDDRAELGGGRAFDCDLAIVALLPNGGADRLPIYEGVVRQFRQRGVEVLLLTDNSFVDRRAGDALWAEGEFVARLAAHYGCALADTAAWMRAAQNRGEKVFADSIHSTAEGQRAWAAAVAGALAHDLPLAAAAPAFDARAGLPAPLQKNVPVAARVDLDPVQTGGVLVEPAPDNQLAALYQAPARVLELGSGAELVVGRPGALSIDLVVDVASGFVAEESSPSGVAAPARTYTHKAPPKILARPQTVTLLTAGETRGRATPELRIRVREGVLRLHAVSYQFASEPPSP